MPSETNGAQHSSPTENAATDESEEQTPGSNPTDTQDVSKQIKRLSEEEKKKNHINSEQKRREQIRRGFDDLTTLVPGTEGLARSENIVLEATIAFINSQISERRRLLALAEANNVPMKDFQIPDEIGFKDGDGQSQLEDSHSLPR